MSPLESIDEFRSRTGVPGVVAGVVDRGGALETAVAGSRRRNAPADTVTADDRWHIGSCGKVMTAVLYGCLVDAGTAEWGTPIVDLFPDLAGVDRAWREPTIDDLFHCRAGVAPNPPLRQMKTLWACELDPAEQRSRAASTVLAAPPRKPGRFRYSNLGYVLAGAAIDRLAGTPYEEALRDFLLVPLGVESLGFGPPPANCGHGARIRLGPLLVGPGRPASPHDVRSDNPTLLTPAGRMHLTIADWAAFQRVILNHGQPVLEEETMRHILAPPVAEPRSMAMGVAPAHRLDGVEYGMQGSNTMWVATALVDEELDRTAMVVVNDGRTSLLRHTAVLATELLERAPR